MLTPADFFEKEQVHPVVVDALLLKRFGPEYYEWEPETLIREIKVEFRATPSSPNMDCIQAVRTIHTSLRFSWDWFVFEKICAGLNNVPVLFSEGQQPTLGHILAAVDAINGSPEGRPAIRPVKFGDDVRKYIAAVIRSDGAYPVPPTLSFCEEFVPKGEPNDNAKDDEDYRKDRVALYDRQMQSIVEWSS